MLDAWVDLIACRSCFNWSLVAHWRVGDWSGLSPGPWNRGLYNFCFLGAPRQSGVFGLDISGVAGTRMGCWAMCASMYDWLVWRVSDWHRQAGDAYIYMSSNASQAIKSVMIVVWKQLQSHLNKQYAIPSEQENRKCKQQLIHGSLYSPITLYVSCLTTAYWTDSWYHW